MGRRDLIFLKSSHHWSVIWWWDENAFPIGYIIPGGFGSGLGIAGVGKSRPGGAEPSGHLCSRLVARSVASVARWSEHQSEHEGWIDIQGDIGCLCASHVFAVVYVSACSYLAGLLFAETVCQVARS